MSSERYKHVIKLSRRYYAMTSRRILSGGLAFILLLSFTLVLLTSHTQAAQITSRSLTLGSGITSASTSYTFKFNLGTAGTTQGIKMQFCTTALGTCSSGPTGLTVASRTFGSQSGFLGGTNFAVSTTNTNDCDGTQIYIVCLNRTDATSESTATQKTVIINAITNPSGASCASSNPNCTFFVRMTTYNTNNFTVGGIVDTGTVASSTVATLTISATVAEVLNFCIGSTAVNDGTSSPGTDCSNISGTAINLGTLDSGNIAITPVTGTGTGFGVNGVAMVRTNAIGGTVINYRAIQAGSGTNHLGSLRVTGATCNAGTANNDQCINSAGTTQTAFSAGTEKFGMTIAGVTCGSTTAYTCNFVTSGNNHLLPDNEYDGSGFSAGGANTFGTSGGFAWDEGGTFDTIATTAVNSQNSAVDDEALILKFAATPNGVTPTGSYSVQTDFIAIATY